jgi:hypothetical protein
MTGRRSAFYFDGGEGRWVVIRWWLPYGHPERAVTSTSSEEKA